MEAALEEKQWNPASLCLQVLPKEVLGNLWKLLKNYFLRKLKVPQEKNETSTPFLLSPIGGVKEEDIVDIKNQLEDMGDQVTSAPAFDFDWEEKVSITASGEKEVDTKNSESESMINASDIGIVSIKADVGDGVENTPSENGLNVTIEKVGDPTDEDEELIIVTMDSSESSDNRSVGINPTEGISTEEEPEDGVEQDDGGEEAVDDREAKIDKNTGSPFDATFSPRRNGARSLSRSLFVLFVGNLMILRNPFLWGIPFK